MASTKQRLLQVFGIAATIIGIAAVIIAIILPHHINSQLVDEGREISLIKSDNYASWADIPGTRGYQLNYDFYLFNIENPTEVRYGLRP